ncbi:MAG: hypothetical protein ABI741_04700 [Ferruginibacter sp.]
MSEQQQSLEDLQHIKRMMERSSRFISLSGLSGIMAGLCALAGAYFAHQVIDRSGGPSGISRVSSRNYDLDTIQEFMGNKLFTIAVCTFISALLLAFLFTYLRSKKNAVPVWGSASRRLMLAVAVPMIAGGFYLLREIQVGNYGLIAPGSLIFYGLALVNASKYTLGEIKYLGYCQIILGIINCWVIGYGLYFWALGFGVLHIIYGVVMWYKYERK